MTDRLRRSYCRAICAVLVVLCTMAVCVLPMDRFPFWNGEIPGHRNQYELMAENLLNGRLHFEYGDEDLLADLENPYDPYERQDAGVYYHWDHAFYNGRYYMYFGVVPVFLLFLPYRLLTGTSLLAFHATQIFVVFIIAGMFALFHMLRRLFFKRMPFGIYLALSAAFSIMSVWYSTAEPALYCTAITSAIALEVWSLYFFIKAVWEETVENRQIRFAALGALLGALAFGCRPPIALANLLVLPMLAEFIRQRKFTLPLLGKLALAALPYAVVAAGLMLYNYARFDNPFEFGQKYQLTVADQSQYGFHFSPEVLLRVVNDTTANLFGFGTISEKFPFLNRSGAFSNFPILLLTAAVFSKKVSDSLKNRRLTGLMTGFAVTVLVITVMDILWTPYLLERYHMDIYFLMGIACFIAIGFWLQTAEEKQRKRLSAVIALLSVVTVVSSFLFWVRTIEVYYPDAVEDIQQALTFWIKKEPG